MKRPWIAWGLAAAVVAVGVAVGAVSLRGPLVDAVVVQSAPLVRTLQFSARVATLSRVDVGSTLTGRVAQVRVAEGAQVRQGDVLVQLESDELRAALAQAVASERQAQARLTGLRSSGRTAAQAASAQASATLQAANASLARVQQLVAEGFYSPAQLDEARRAVDVARAQQLSAQAQMQANADAGTDVVQAQAQLALAQAATVAAQARLAQTALVAPADARVLVRAVEPGQIVQPGKALLSLALAGPTAPANWPGPQRGRYGDFVGTAGAAAVVPHRARHAACRRQLRSARCAGCAPGAAGARTACGHHAAVLCTGR